MLPKASPRGREHGIEGRLIGHVAMAEHHAADLVRQRLDPLLERITLIREGELCAMCMSRLGDPPCERPIVGKPHDQAAFSAQQTRGVH